MLPHRLHFRMEAVSAENSVNQLICQTRYSDGVFSLERKRLIQDVVAFPRVLSYALGALTVQSLSDDCTMSIPVSMGDDMSHATRDSCFLACHGPPPNEVENEPWCPQARCTGRNNVQFSYHRGLWRKWRCDTGRDYQVRGVIACYCCG